jgi:hypothetical protein
MPFRPCTNAAGIASGWLSPHRPVGRDLDRVGVAVALLIGHSNAQTEQSIWGHEFAAKLTSVAAIHRQPLLIVDPNSACAMDAAPQAEALTCRMFASGCGPIASRRSAGDVIITNGYDD